jgi:hypothetical protein
LPPGWLLFLREASLVEGLGTVVLLRNQSPYEINARTGAARRAGSFAPHRGPHFRADGVENPEVGNLRPQSTRTANLLRMGLEIDADQSSLLPPFPGQGRRQGLFCASGLDCHHHLATTGRPDGQSLTRWHVGHGVFCIADRISKDLTQGRVRSENVTKEMSIPVLLSSTACD